MPKFNEGNTATGYFEVNDVPYQKGEWRSFLDATNETFGIYPDSRGREITKSEFLFTQQGYASWTNQAGTPYASFAALVTDLKAAFFFS